MKNEVQIFSNDQFGQVRANELNGKIYFCGKDVAVALGYANVNDALQRHCKKNGVVKHEVIDNMGRNQTAKFIDEGNLYRLITHSKLPSAEQFESWVFDEVLPTLRKTGTYTVKKTDKVKEQLAEARQRNARAREASVYLKLADRVTVETYRQILISKSAEVLAGQMILPLPSAPVMSYSAKDIGDMLGISGNMVGRLANKYGLKTPEYGELVWDKSQSSAHQCQTFRYYISVVPALKKIMEQEVA